MRVVRVVAFAALLGLEGCTGHGDDSGAPEDAGAGASSLAAQPLQEAIETFCSHCHRYAEPGILPRDRWETEVRLMYDLWRQTLGGKIEDAPPMDAVIAWFVERAPEHLPAIASTAKAPSGPVEFLPRPTRFDGLPPYPGVANVSVVHLLDDRYPEILLCEMRFNAVFLLQPWVQAGRILRLGEALHPGHAEVVDLDGDELRDVLVSCLGTPTPSDEEKGEVLWLRGRPGGRFDRHVLASGLGRVADARAADFDGDGDQDVVVAIFGWRQVGELVWLQNDGFQDGQLSMQSFVIDSRHGPISLAVTDLNADEKPDFICLFAQEHEVLSAFINLGYGIFEERVLFAAPHPNWGSSNISLADLDGDGDQDILFVNGDSLDDMILKPYHGVQWLENHGELRFEVHRLTDACGVHSAGAGDFDGDGDLDIAVSAFLPFLRRETPGVDLAEPLIWLEQTAPGTFRRWPLESGPCFHPSLAVADIDGDGRSEIVVANMTFAKRDGDDLEDWLTIWQNRGPRAPADAAPKSP